MYYHLADLLNPKQDKLLLWNLILIPCLKKQNKQKYKQKKPKSKKKKKETLVWHTLLTVLLWLFP